MFVTAVLRDKERRAQVAERVAFAVETMPTDEPLPVADSYRTQAPGDAPAETVERPAPVVSTTPRDPANSREEFERFVTERLVYLQAELGQVSAQLDAHRRDTTRTLDQLDRLIPLVLGR